MASGIPNNNPQSSAQLAIADIVIEDPATACDASQNNTQPLLTASTSELTQRPTVSEAAKTQVHDRLKAKDIGIPIVATGSCHFMKLPPELRLIVYKLVFPKPPTVVSRDAWFRRIRNVPLAALHHHIRTMLAVLHTSRTLRAESFGVFTQLAYTRRTSVQASLEQLRPGWQNELPWNVSIGHNLPHRDEHFRRFGEL